MPWDVARTADNRLRRCHWSARSRLFKMARSLAREAWEAAGAPATSRRVRASFVFRRARAMDLTNCVNGAKPICDGIFVNALVPDDSPKWLEIGSIKQEVGKQWKGREEVEISVEEVGIAPDPRDVRLGQLVAATRPPERRRTWEELDRIGKARRGGGE